MSAVTVPDDRIGAGVEAEPIARAALEAYDHGRADGFEEHMHALLSLAAALVNRRQPEPDEAAVLAGRGVGMLDERPTSSVTAKIGEVAVTLQPYGGLAPVRDFRERLAARPQLALPSGAA
jgi:hypothetical protein